MSFNSKDKLNVQCMDYTAISSMIITPIYGWKSYYLLVWWSYLFGMKLIPFWYEVHTFLTFLVWKSYRFWYEIQLFFLVWNSYRFWYAQCKKRNHTYFGMNFIPLFLQWMNCGQFWPGTLVHRGRGETAMTYIPQTRANISFLVVCYWCFALVRVRLA